MKVTKYALSLFGSETIELPIFSASIMDKFIMKSITGLGPPEFTINLGKTIYQASAYQGNQPQQRQLVILMGLNPNYAIGETVESLREILYGLIGTDESDALDFEVWNGDEQVAVIAGWVSKVEPAIFNKDPLMQITIECVAAYFSAPAPVNVDLTTMSKVTLSFTNIGSISTGFRLAITLTSALASYQISNSFGHMNVTYAFHSGDQIIFDTRDGNRDVIRIRAGVPLSLIDMLDDSSTWLKVTKALNSIAMSSNAFNYNSFEYTPHYLGV